MKVKLINNNIYNNYTETLLGYRGVRNFNDFVCPPVTNLQGWEDLDNMDTAVSLVIHTIDNNGKIGLVVDCDVDGFTSSSIFYQYLRRVGVPEENIHYYIHEGKQHGLEDVWQEMVEENFDLVVLPDAGTNDGKYAQHFHCPVLILDHHLLEKSSILAENMVIVNNQISTNYKNKNLSGAGIVYQFCRAMDDTMKLNYAHDYIDLAALGVCADMMSGLEPENQYLWKEGFSHVNNYFMQTVAKKQAYSITGNKDATDSEIEKALNPTSIAFYVVPMMNAMIRVGTLPEKERLFMAFINGHTLVPCNKRGAKGTLEEVAVESVRECTNARNHQNKILEKASDIIEAKIHKCGLLDNKVLFIRLDEDDDFPSTLNGLVAMKLSQRFQRPTIVARLNDEGFDRGSMRGLNKSAVKSFKDFLESSKMFEYVAGHDNAAGVSIPDRSLDLFHHFANNALKNTNFGENIYEVNFSRDACKDTDWFELIDDLDNYRDVWSQQNDEPLIYVHNLNIDADSIQVIGRNHDTIKWNKNGVTYIKFLAKDLIQELSEKNGLVNIELVGHARMNEWNGRRTPQIMIEEVEVKAFDCGF